MMELDELKQKWADYDHKLETGLRLNRMLLTANTLDRARSALRRLAILLALGAVATLAIIIVLGTFIYDNFALMRYALPAAVLHVFAIAVLISQIRQLVLILRIDYAQPVATIQKQLVQLRLARIRHIQGALLLATLAWTPLLIVVLWACFGINVYREFSLAWLASNVLLGLAIIPLAIWISKEFGDRMGRSPFLQRFMRDLAGYNLNAATGFLASISEFEKECD
jgi:hypothetical protein